MALLTYAIARTEDGGSVDDKVHPATVVVDQRDVVAVEVVAVWRLVERHVDRGIVRRRNDRRTSYPAYTAQRRHIQ